eukprot:INCI3285.4.p1 GENE.INCI3285.4~~INCI3285.4.p1  ORF type:complete len:1408 (-),score=217.48 INCI3285.4:617-4840(-)
MMAVRVSVFGAVALVLSLVPACVSMPANPNPFNYTLYDGSNLTVRLRGNELGNLLVLEENGQVIVEVDPPEGNTGIDFKYATVDEVTGAVMPTGPRVKDVDPASFEKVDPRTVRVVLNPEKVARMRPPSAKASAGLKGRRLVEATGLVRNLMCLIRFSDHKSRTLPTVQQITNLMNEAGGGADAPSGSVRDVYLENSYGTFDLTSTVTPWYDCTLTERQAAGTDSATGSDSRLDECMRQCLTKAAADYDLVDFDSDDDGVIDAVGFLHSGYGAELGGADCNGVGYKNRIWSHKWGFYPPFEADGISVPEYHISPGLWGDCGSEIGRMGVIAHETGHFFGLPDLYDYSDTGSGLGDFALMANSWGVDGSQYYPPAFNAWSRVTLGWITDVIVVDDASDAGQYTLNAIGGTPEVMKITYGFSHPDEYLLVSNRRPYGIDSLLPADGVFVWHVDDSDDVCSGQKTNGCPGYPGQSCWPFNGQHYWVALIQADGFYDLEKGYSADSQDVFIGPNAELSDCGGSSCQPNCRAYQGGIIALTGITLSGFSNAGDSVTFTVELDDSTSGNAVNPPAECGPGIDKSGNCNDCIGATCNGYEDWIGDGACDDGEWGLYFNCDAFNFDEGDCDCSAGQCITDGTTGSVSSSAASTATSTTIVATTDTSTTSSPESIPSTIGLSSTIETTAAFTAFTTATSATGFTSSSLTATPVTTASTDFCVSYDSWLGDGYCDDFTNVLACGWDGGDCCGCTCNCADFCFSPCGEGGYNCLDPENPAASCTTQAPVPCEGRWSDWGTCECEGGTSGTESRTFSIEVEAQGAGRDCEWDDEEVDDGECTCTTTTTTAPPPCLSAGDGQCTNECNNAIHNWDGGDCCLSTCTAANFSCNAERFECLNPTAVENGGAGNCSALPFDWVGDAYCDNAAEGFNTAACGWDGGDCCLSTCSDSANYTCGATSPACLDPSASENSDPACAARPNSWVGDGYCDSVFPWGDGTDFNSGLCGWDGGDCCASTCNGTCSGFVFTCRDPDAEENFGRPETCGEPFSWLGDGFCDLIANVQSCSWDLGDCCESTCDDSLKDACNDAAGSGCFGANCDVWVAVGDTCGVLELQYGCDCSGCVCDENAKIPAYDCGTGGYACVDPDAAESPKFPEGCEPDDDVEVSWIGDGFCDAEELNTEACGWDGGDCCGDTCESLVYQCGSFTSFACKDPSSNDGCSSPESFAGDGYCDVAFNTHRCSWDAGDCCAGSCVPKCASRCPYSCGTPEYACADPRFDTTTTTTTTTTVAATTTLVSPDCSVAGTTGCITVVAEDITPEICADLGGREMTAAFVNRIFTNFASALGTQHASVYFLTSSEPIVNCTDVGLEITILVRAAHRAAFQVAFGRRLIGDEIEYGGKSVFFELILLWIYRCPGLQR